MCAEPVYHVEAGQALQHPGVAMIARLVEQQAVSQRYLQQGPDMLATERIVVLAVLACSTLCPNRMTAPVSRACCFKP